MKAQTAITPALNVERRTRLEAQAFAQRGARCPAHPGQPLVDGRCPLCERYGARR